MDAGRRDEMKHVLRMPALAVYLAITAGMAVAQDSVADLTPYQNIDEELFLVNELESEYATWPSDNDPKILLATLERMRGHVHDLRRAIAANHLSAEVALLYDDFAILIDANEECLKNLGVIDQRTIESAKTAALKEVIKGAMNSYADHADGKTGTEILYGLAWEVTSAAIRQGWSIYSTRKEAIDNEQQRFQRKVVDTFATAKSLAAQLTRERGWGPEEADFSSLRGVSFRERANKRPRDPVALFWLAEENQEKDTTSAQHLRRSYQIVKAVKMIPAGPYYNWIRALLLQDAISLAIEAVATDRQYYSDGPTPETPFAVALCRAFLAIDPVDELGFGHAELARALAFSGRYEEAIGEANKVPPQYQYDLFSYRCAKLYSLTNSPDKSAEWLLRAYSMGFNLVGVVRADRDLDNLRRARPDVFTTLTTVKLSYKVDFGAVWDDVIVYNESAFDLTDFNRPRSLIP